MVASPTDLESFGSMLAMDHISCRRLKVLKGGRVRKIRLKRINLNSVHVVSIDGVRLREWEFYVVKSKEMRKVWVG